MENIIPRRRSSRLRGATPLKMPVHVAAQLESVTECSETSVLKTQKNNDDKWLVPKTPVTAARIRPAPEEMHPSKAHQSTTQEPDSGLRLGFTDIKVESIDQPSGPVQKTPSKIKVARPSFDFRCPRPGLQLGPEAQRIMDELNEEALRIRAALAAEREEKKRMISYDEQLKTNRNTKPRCKTGRFSDAHKAEFNKMDSIVGHPSTFRAQISRTAPVIKNLKRSPSKAQLDTRNTYGMVDKNDRGGENLCNSHRHDVNQPTKIARKYITDDISSASRNQEISSTSNISSSRSKIPSAIGFPTQASLSRANVKKLTPKEPTSSKSVQKVSFSNSLSPGGINTFNGNSCKLDRVRLPAPSLGTTIEPAVLSDISDRKSKNDLHKVFSTCSSRSGIGSSKITKNMNFTPKTINKHAIAARNSPSPMRSGIARSISKSNLKVNSLNAINLKALEPSRKIENSSLSNLQSLHQDYKPSSIPGTFTFRSDQTIKFGVSPNHSGSTLIKNSNPQLDNNQGLDSVVQSLTENYKENKTPISLFSPGISNKRKMRPNSDDEQSLIERSSKKPKNQDSKSTIPRLKVKQGSLQKIPSPQKKPRILSLSRLNILSRPKIRR